MQLITEPTVVLVGTTSIDQYEIRAALEKLGFTWDDLAQVSGDDAEWLVEMAGRTCYQSWRRQNDPSMGGRTHADHIANLIDSGHLSCLEHCSMTFLLAGLSRSLTHELVRHRIGVAYSQLSQRFVDSSDVNFVVPPDVQGMADDNPSLYAAWVSHCEASVELYKRLEQHIDLECSLALSPRDRHKKARQAARSVLPNATETRMLFTANVRQLRHMIASRASAAADLEIRNLFIQIFEVFKDKYPLLAHGMSTVQLPDGTRGVVS